MAQKRLIPIVARVDGSQAKKEIKSLKEAFKGLERSMGRKSGSSSMNAEGARLKSQLRIFEAMEKHKLRLVEMRVRGQQQAEGRAFRAEQALLRRNYQEYVRIQREKTKVAQQEARRRAKAESGHMLRSAGVRTGMLGRSALVGMTLPIVGGARALAEVGFSLDDMRNKLTASTGSLEKANAKLKELRDLSRESAGVMAKDAVDTFAMLKPIAGITDDAINPLIQALGRLKLADRELNMTEFTRNLTQMFTQGFEMQDVKQAFNNFPRFGEVIAEKFGIEGTDRDSISKALKGMVASGKLSINEYFKGIAEAVNEDENLGKLRDTLQIRFAKAFERIQFAFEPMAMAMLDVIEPMLEPLTKFIEQMANAFSSLSKPVQMVVFGIVALAGAIGPLLLILSPILTTLGYMATAVKTVSVFVAGSGGLAGAFTALGAILAPIAVKIAVVVGVITALAGVAFLVYQAWQSNFGGLRDYTIALWQTVSKAIEKAMQYIRAIVAEVGGEVIAWWMTNYPAIEDTVNRVSDAIKARVATFVKVVNAFWKEHGEFIMFWVSKSWENVRIVVTGVTTHILNVIKLVMAIFRGDWTSAWDAFVTIVANAVEMILKLQINFGKLLLRGIWEIIKGLWNAILSFWSWTQAKVKEGVDWVVDTIANLPDRIVALVPQFIDAGSKLGEALGNAIVNAMRGVEAPVLATAGNAGGVDMADLQSKFDRGLELMDGLRKPRGAGLGGSGEGGKGKKGKQKLDPIAELRKQLKEANALKALLTDNSLFRQLTVEVDAVESYTSALTNLIKKRAELGISSGNATPQTMREINDEMERLGEAESGLSDARNMFREMEDAIRNIGMEKTKVAEVSKLLADPTRSILLTEEEKTQLRQKAIEYDRLTLAEQFKEASKASSQYQLDRINDLNTEIGLLTTKDPLQQEQIRLSAELAKYEQELKDLGEENIQILLQKRILQNEAYLEKYKEFLLTTKTVRQEEDAEALMEQMRDMMVDKNKLSQEAIILKMLEKKEWQGVTDEIRQQLILMGKQVDEYKRQEEAQKKAEERFEELSRTIEDKLDILRTEGFGGFFRSILEDFQRFLQKMVARWLASKFFKMFSGEGDQSFGGIFGGGGGSGSGFGGGIGNIFKKLFGGGGGGSRSSGGGGGHEGAHAGAVDDAFGGGGLGGTLAGIGAIASIAGGAIGGRWGNVISMAGTGMSIGAMIGGPIGAAIGAGAGALFGFLMGDPKRKRDKKEKMPQLQQGFTDAFASLRQILDDLKGFRVDDVEGVIRQAEEIRSQIASGFGIQFESKKYRKKAKALIGKKLTEADAILEQIRDAGILAREKNEQRRVAEARDRRLLPEFAMGGFIRRNGMLGGRFTGRDTLPSMLAHGEMVLNPTQIARVIATTGFDPFRYAGIPNYSEGTYINSSANTASFGAPQINVVVHVEQDAQGMFKGWLEGPDGVDTTVKIVQKSYANDRLKLRRR